jgi:tRNA-uridine 2-sulfurtransferase
VPLKELNWLGDESLADAPASGWDVEVKVRSTRAPKLGRLLPNAGGSASVELFAAEEGVSPGQACAFYEPGSSRVLGGGWITR